MPATRHIFTYALIAATLLGIAVGWLSNSYLSQQQATACPLPLAC
jgi:hypothetical protein